MQSLKFKILHRLHTRTHAHRRRARFSLNIRIHTGTCVRMFANNAHLYVCMYICMYFVLRSAPLSPHSSLAFPTPRFHFPTLALSLCCRRVVVVLLFFKLTAQLEFFRQCELRCRCHRVAAAHRFVVSVRERKREERDFFLNIDKMPYGSSSRYATVGGGGAAAAETATATKTVIIYAIKCNLVHCIRISDIYRTLLRMLCRHFRSILCAYVCVWEDEFVTLSSIALCIRVLHEFIQTGK